MITRKNTTGGKKTRLAAIAAAISLTAYPSLAEERLAVEPPDLAEVQAEIEEVVVIGRLIDASQRLVEERLGDADVSDVLGADAISRLGDSTAADALRRISGLSLVNNKFIYVRGLGERYSSTSLNGAFIPSPDLTRNVIPLDIFPTSIIESLQVQKSYSPDRSAAFGGGAIDIRTKGVPDGFTYSLQIGSGYNFANDGDVFTTSGGSRDTFGTDDGSRALSPLIDESLARFAGDLDPQTILGRLINEGNVNASIDDAVALNQQIALTLNRDLTLSERSTDPDYNFRGSIGNSWFLGEHWELGALIGGSYQQNWRETTAISRNFAFPEERTDTELESTRATQLNGIGNLGIRFTDDHEIAYTGMYLRSTDDETAVRDFFNENREISDGLGFREVRIDFEERDLTVNQVKGSHKIGAATLDALPKWLANLVDWVPEEFQFDWFISDARAETVIPNQVRVDFQTVTDPITGEVITAQVALDQTAADFFFTQLEDDLQNFGFEGTLPLYFNNTFLELSGGYNYARKARVFEQTQFGIGFTRVDNPATLQGDLSDVFSDINILSPNNDFAFDRQGTNNQSYLAGTITTAAFGAFDVTFNETLRIAGGLRWEDYNQVALDFNNFGFTASNPQITTDPEALENAIFSRSDIFPSVAITYISNWWAETFQLRFGWSETAVRPDLREITDASYIDPLTDDLVDGNPGVTPSDVTNFDLRAEWFFSNGDNLTVSGFYKDIDNPIEFFESAASDTNTAREIVNAASAEVFGVEVEGTKNLAFLGGGFSNFYVQANVTWQDSELVAGTEADAPTNQVRQLAGAADFVINAQLGFDSSDTRHSATLVYNVFGERLFVAGRLGAPDGFEQPFNSLDLTYSWYPSETLTVKAKLQNILDETIEIQRAGVVTFEEKPGAQISASVQWAF